MGRRRKKGDKVDGWVILDKPLEMGSTPAVSKVRRILNAQKAGHAGTLDPLATGVLAIALGEATKTIPYVQDAQKTYSFTVSWGEQRSTDDAEGEVIARSDVRPDKNSILSALADFIGDITQTPPQYSAIKINGERAYDIARAGDVADIKSRTVSVYDFQCVDTPDEHTARFIVECGKGTYVRSLARDLALKLGTVGYVSALRREKLGDFDVKDAISLDFLCDLGESGDPMQAVKPLESALDDIPALSVKEGEAARIGNGNDLAFIARPDFERLKSLKFSDKYDALALAVYEGKPLALVEVNKARVKPIRVFNINT